MNAVNLHELEEGLYSRNITWLFMFRGHIKDANEMCFVGSKIPTFTLQSVKHVGQKLGLS
jgi:hypothetical protein